MKLRPKEPQGMLVASTVKINFEIHQAVEEKKLDTVFEKHTENLHFLLYYKSCKKQNFENP